MGQSQVSHGQACKTLRLKHPRGFLRCSTMVYHCEVFAYSIIKRSASFNDGNLLKLISTRAVFVVILKFVIVAHNDDKSRPVLR